MSEGKEVNLSEFDILKRTFDAIEDPIFYLDTNGVILHANSASSRLLGLPPEKILGEQCFRVVHHTPTFIRGCPFVKARETGRREIYTVNLANHWYQVSVDPVKDESGAVLGAVHILTNIDTVKKVHELRAVLGAIIEMTPDAILGETPDGTIISWNHGAEETFGYSADEMIGESIAKIIPPGYLDDWKGMLMRVQRGERIEQFETRRIRKGGEELELSLSLSPILDERGIVTGIAVIGRNLTEIRKAERALIAYVTEAALRIKNPVGIIAHTLEEIRQLHKAGAITDEELSTTLLIQVKHAMKIVENVGDLQQSIISGLDEIPESYRKFLMDEE